MTQRLPVPLITSSKSIDSAINLSTNKVESKRHSASSSLSRPSQLMGGSPEANAENARRLTIKGCYQDGSS